MGLLMLAAAQGTTIDVTVNGTEAEALMSALDALIASRFGEER
jgi:phosphocarrier protein